MTLNNDVDLQGCEHCDGVFPIETMTSMEDCWFCERCMEEWRRIFAACKHQWRPEPHFSVHGEEGRVCDQCGGFVANEDAAAMGLVWDDNARP